MVFISMNKNIIKVITLVLCIPSCMTVSMKLLADNQTSPYTNLNIIALEIIQPENILRLFVKRRIEIDAGSFDFNPANCPAVVKAIEINDNIEIDYNNEGADYTQYNIQYFDIPLGVINRSAIEQRQLLNKTFASFITSRVVRLIVRDDSCSSMNGRLVSGISVN